MTQLQVEYFLHVAISKSISKSAAELYVSSPAISKQITMMEQELGLNLFLRGAHGMELTPEGQVMFDFYLNQKNSLNEALSRARSLGADQVNTLHLGVMSCWCIHRQLQQLQALLLDSPTPTNLVCHSVFDPGNSSRLEKGGFDAALCLGDDLFTTALTTSLHITRITKIQKMIFFSSRLPLASKPDLTLVDFADLPLLSFSSELRPNAQYDNLRLCNSFEFRPRLVLKSSLEDAFLNAAMGNGFLIGDEWIMQKNLPEFSTLPLKDSHTIYLVWSEQNRNPGLKLLEKYCENEIDWTV